MNTSRLAVLVLALLAPGCGYQSGDSTTVVAGYEWKSLYRNDVRTVAVPIFTTKDFSRNVEFQVSTALVKQIEAFTPYKVIGRDHADTILEGEIVSVRPTPLNISPTNDTPQEQLMSVVVNFTWKDLRTGEILVERKDVRANRHLLPDVGRRPVRRHPKRRRTARRRHRPRDGSGLVIFAPAGVHFVPFTPRTILPTLTIR